MLSKRIHKSFHLPEGFYDSFYYKEIFFRTLSNLCANYKELDCSCSTVKTAREKKRSVTAEEAAAALADAEKVIKSSNSRSTPPLRNTMSMSNSRANKPLGWFLAEDIFGKIGAVKVEGSKSPEDKKKRRTRRSSTKKSSELMSNATQSEEGSVTSDDLFEDKQRDGMPRDDYWYYDVASDGYYYEQNGAKGWRRRMPNSALHKIKEQEMAQLANAGKPTSMSPQAQAAAQAALLQTQLYNPTSLKYYDPSSDGYFYEMASVDGWKRRQPPSASSSSSSSKGSLPANSPPSSSYGACLARGQLPRTSIIDDSSASSSISEDTISTDPFGADAGFSFPEPVARPDSLNMEEKPMLNGFDPAMFIKDLSFSALDHSKIMAFKASTPADTWATRCNNWKTQGEEISASPDEDALNLMLKELEAIWQAPTPVKNP